MFKKSNQKIKVAFMFFAILKNSRVKNRQTKKVNFILQMSALIGVWLIQRIQYKWKKWTPAVHAAWEPREGSSHHWSHSLTFYFKHKWMFLIWRQTVNLIFLFAVTAQAAVELLHCLTGELCSATIIICTPQLLLIFFP